VFLEENARGGIVSLSTPSLGLFEAEGFNHSMTGECFTYHDIAKPESTLFGNGFGL